MFENNIDLWLFTTASKRSPVKIIHFILTKFKNDQHPFRYMIVDKDGALENSAYGTNLIVDDFSTAIETTGGDAS